MNEMSATRFPVVLKAGLDGQRLHRIERGRTPAVAMNPSPINFESYDSMEGIVALDATSPPARFQSWPQARLIHAVYPGVLVAGTIALASTWLAQHYTAPVMLFALLFGMAFHFLHEGGRCVAGIEFASRSVLRPASRCLACASPLGQIASLGLAPVVTVIVGVATTILFGFLLARRLGLSRLFGVLSGGAVAICGASAALAIASVLPRHENSERDTILTVVSVTALSTLAMILYPISPPRSGSTTSTPAFSSAARSTTSPRWSARATRFRPRPATSRPTSSCCGSRCCCPSCSRSRSPSRGTAARQGAQPTLPMFLIGFAAAGRRQFARPPAARRDRRRQRRLALVPGRRDRGARHEDLVQGAVRRRRAPARADSIAETALDRAPRAGLRSEPRVPRRQAASGTRAIVPKSDPS